MAIKKIVFLIFVSFLIFLFFLATRLISNGKNKESLLWTKDVVFESDSARDRAIQKIDEIASFHLLRKEFVDSPSKLVGQRKYFYHYKLDENVVMTVHDLKGSGRKLTIYFYGLKDEKNNNVISSKMKLILGVEKNRLKLEP
jgi:hypothetical protein